MLTSYMVTCPHEGCHWSGSLLPQINREAWRGATVNTRTVLFQCPQCGGHWHARVVGDDVKPLPLQESEMVVPLA